MIARLLGVFGLLVWMARPAMGQPGRAPIPYSLPWQLRPAAAATVVRSDVAVAFRRDPGTGDHGTTVATTLLVSYRLASRFAPLVRFGLVRNVSPTGEGATAVVNPVVGGSYLVPLGHDVRLALFLGLALPVGVGGGDSPEAAVAAAASSGVLARSAMDNAMFAVNDFTVFPGADS